MLIGQGRKRVWPICNSLYLVILTGFCFFGAFGADVAPQPRPQVAITPRSRLAASPGTRSNANLRLDVKLVLVPVSVTDALDRPINTLSQDAFRVLEDGIEQTITSF